MRKLRNQKGDSRRRKVFEIPKSIGIGWTAKPRTLLRSQVWRSLGIYERRALDALERGHCSNAGTENGFLVLTFDEGVRAGIPRRFFNRTMMRLISLGLVIMTRKGSYAGGARLDPNLYRLTYLPHKIKESVGPPIYLFPTNNWIAVELDIVAGKSALRDKRHKPPTRKKQNNGIKYETDQVSKTDTDGAESDPEKPTIVALPQ